MYELNPALTSHGVTAIYREPTQCFVPPNLENVLAPLLNACQLLSALRTLQSPVTGDFIASSVAQALRHDISLLLRTSAHGSHHSALRTALHARADSYLNDDYTAAAVASADQPLPVELLMGAIPSWRFSSHHRLHAAICALPVQDAADTLTPDEHEYVAGALERLRSETGVPPLRLVQEPPIFVACDLLAVAGDAAGLPVHIGNFLPQDEGVYRVPCRKTLLYRNIYVRRFHVVSANLADATLTRTLFAHIPDEEHIWKYLSSWFRGHDIAHLYFDHLCKQLVGLSKQTRYALQELIADLVGLVARSRSRRDGGHSAWYTPHGAVSVFLAELLRYYTRDHSLFPDACAASVELNICLQSQVLRITDDGRLDGDPESVLRCLNKFLDTLVTAVTSRDVAYIQSLFISDERTESKTQLASLTKRLTMLTSLATEFEPLFVTASSILASTSPSDARPSAAMRAAHHRPVEAEHCCRRF